MSKNKNTIYFEVVLYLFVVITVLMIPFVNHKPSEVGWAFIIRDWLQLIPFLLIFLVNNFLLVPKLLFKSKYLPYIFSCVLTLILILGLHNVYIVQNPDKKRPPGHESREMQKPPGDHANFEKRERNKPPRHFPSDTFFNFRIFIVGLLIIGFNTGVKLFVHWSEKEKFLIDRERQFLNTELAYLKQQISPHFFMNTLNNIHALVDINSVQAKEAIIKLSRLMRYLLYEDASEQVPLNKEIEFLESYIELIRLRYDESKLEITIDYPKNTEDIFVPSLLFLPLVENAFKYGVELNKKSFVFIRFHREKDYLSLQIKNSNYSRTYKRNNQKSGIGIHNIKKRLYLIYKDNYRFNIHSNNEIFEIELEIPIESKPLKMEMKV